MNDCVAEGFEAVEIGKLSENHSDLEEETEGWDKQLDRVRSQTSEVAYVF